MDLTLLEKPVVQTMRRKLAGILKDVHLTLEFFKGKLKVDLYRNDKNL
jgi:hypothetical protein